MPKSICELLDVGWKVTLLILAVTPNSTHLELDPEAKTGPNSSVTALLTFTGICSWAPGIEIIKSRGYFSHSIMVKEFWKLIPGEEKSKILID